jgi:hypothetical protein
VSNSLKSNCILQNGVVLVTTIMMLGLITILILSQLQQIFLYHKAIRQIDEHQQKLYRLEAIANQLVRDIKVNINEACVVPEQDPDEVVDKLKNTGGCLLSDANESYEYLIEELGIFPCLQVDFNNHRYSTWHRRLTIRLRGQRLGFLQLRIAQQVSKQFCVEEQIRIIKQGIISWRFRS